jgi:hypothetical protein
MHGIEEAHLQGVGRKIVKEEAAMKIQILAGE